MGRKEDEVVARQRRRRHKYPFDVAIDRRRREPLRYVVVEIVDNGVDGERKHRDIAAIEDRLGLEPQFRETVATGSSFRRVPQDLAEGDV